MNARADDPSAPLPHDDRERQAVYGLPPVELADAAGARQLSPLIPGSGRLEDLSPGALDALTVLAPAGTAERRYVLALGLRALAPGGRLLALAPKERGGARLAGELRGHGCTVFEEARRHHRICRTIRPDRPEGLEAAIGEGAPRRLDDLGLDTQPGIFSWNRIDPGSALLLANLPPLSGRGADLGCGLGVLALGALRAPKVTALSLIDIDRRAIEAARANVGDPRAAFLWADVRGEHPALSRLDFVVTNPPFHDGGGEDRALGATFIARAAAALRPGGTFLITANAHLPYEAPLRAAFRGVEAVAASGGYKVYAARR